MLTANKQKYLRSLFFSSKDNSILCVIFYLFCFAFTILLPVEFVPEGGRCYLSGLCIATSIPPHRLDA